jgi:membrane peptidoglycan carboxypeptidase
LGVEAGKAYASRVGIPFEENDTGLTLALGGFTKGITPLTLCNAYTPFANGGYYSYPSCIAKITDSAGNVIYSRPDTKVNVLSKETSFLMTSVLETTATTGTAKKLHIDGVPIAAKTGTSEADSRNRDVWTIAYNPEYTVCCWMGFDSTDAEHSLPADDTGGTYPAGLIRKVFSTIYTGKQAPDFTQPGSIEQAKIDLKSLGNAGGPMLASAFTPKDEMATEYFLKKNVPTEYSNYWAVPSPPNDLSVAHGDGGYPEITFTPPESFAKYRLMRLDSSESEPTVIGEYTGDMPSVTVTDDTAQYGHAYSYYVIPVHPEIKINGGPLEGPSSAVVQISMASEDNYMP